MVAAVGGTSVTLAMPGLALMAATASVPSSDAAGLTVGPLAAVPGGTVASATFASLLAEQQMAAAQGLASVPAAAVPSANALLAPGEIDADLQRAMAPPVTGAAEVLAQVVAQRAEATPVVTAAAPGSPGPGHASPAHGALPKLAAGDLSDPSGPSVPSATPVSAVRQPPRGWPLREASAVAEPRHQRLAAPAVDAAAQGPSEPASPAVPATDAAQGMDPAAGLPTFPGMPPPPPPTPLAPVAEAATPPSILLPTRTAGDAAVANTISLHGEARPGIAPATSAATRGPANVAMASNDPAAHTDATEPAHRVDAALAEPRQPSGTGDGVAAQALLPGHSQPEPALPTPSQPEPTAHQAVKRATAPDTLQAAVTLTIAAETGGAAAPAEFRATPAETSSLPAWMAPAAFTPRAVETAPPPVVYLPTPVDAPEFRDVLGMQVSQLAGEGVHRAELSLNPADMGPISVRIDMQGDQAQVVFGADSAQTRSLIEAGWAELAVSLQDAGFTLSGGGVSQHAPDRQAAGAQATPARGARQASDAPAPDTAAAAVPRPLPGAALDVYA